MFMIIQNEANVKAANRGDGKIMGMKLYEVIYLSPPVTFT